MINVHCSNVLTTLYDNDNMLLQLIMICFDDDITSNNDFREDKISPRQMALLKLE